MSGIDKIKERILEDAEAEALRKLSDARKKADEIRSAAERTARAESEDLLKKARSTSLKYSERIDSFCEMRRRQAILTAKQDMISDVLDKAYRKVLMLGDEDYFDMIYGMLEKYALPMDGEARFRAFDIARFPKDFAEKAYECARKKGGALTVSETPADIDGGFILVYGGIEVNCTVRALFDSKRDELSDVVRRAMF